MKITMKLDMKPVKQRPYRLNPKYRERVRTELDKMLAAGIIEPVEESNWVSPIVVQEKKQKEEIRICMDLWKLNDSCVHDPFPTLFTDEFLDNVGGQEAYSFIDGFSGYHQIKIAPEDRSKTTFVTEWRCFQYTIPDRAQSKEVYVLCPLWDLARACGVQTGIDDGPHEDRGDNQLGGAKECEIVARNPEAYWML
eukprot:PITA_10514